MKHVIKGLVCSSLLWSSLAFGDAMPSCPPGETVQMNPVQPGAMHHAGGKCVPDPNYKPKPEPPKLTPEQEAEAKQKIIITELESNIARLQAELDFAKNAAAQAKGTPDEEAKNKAVTEAEGKVTSAKKALEDAQKNPVKPAATSTDKTPTQNNAGDTKPKTGGCAVSQEASPAGLFLFALLLLLPRRARAKRPQ
jgi:hypothetical protein